MGNPFYEVNGFTGAINYPLGIQGKKIILTIGNKPISVTCEFLSSGLCFTMDTASMAICKRNNDTITKKAGIAQLVVRLILPRGLGFDFSIFCIVKKLFLMAIMAGDELLHMLINQHKNVDEK